MRQFFCNALSTAKNTILLKQHFLLKWVLKLEIRFEKCKVTDFRSFICLQNSPLSYKTLSKSSKNYMFSNWILQEFLSWPFLPVQLGCDHLYHVSKTMKGEQSQRRAHQRNSLISFLWPACATNQLPPSPEEKWTLKKSPTVCLSIHQGIQNPKRIKRVTPAVLS